MNNYSLTGYCIHPIHSKMFSIQMLHFNAFHISAVIVERSACYRSLECGKKTVNQPVEVMAGCIYIVFRSNVLCTGWYLLHVDWSLG